MRRIFALAVFALAAAGATLAGSGLVVAPHVDPPGTPRFHDHVLAAYRFPIFVMRLQQLHDRGEKLTLVPPVEAAAGAMVMALLVFAAPRIARPARRPLAYLPAPLIARALWIAPLRHGPPRG